MSGLFGGLLKPGEGAKFAIERHLTGRRQFWLQRKPSEWIYAGPEDFILTHGRYFQGAACPDEYREHCGPMQRCYVNAMRAALAHPELTYFEGLYDVGGGPVSHAWCVDRQGRIVELTFHPDGTDQYMLLGRGVQGLAAEHWAYYGVAINAAYVEDHFHRHGLGLLRPDCGLRILTYHYDPDRTTV